MAIQGASAGGITVGRAVTERPELFAAAVPRVGIMNVLRYEFTPNGPVNIPEFGSQKTEAGFKALLAMDAYQNIESGKQYPAQFVTAGYHDPRVILWQPAKYAAKMQEANSSTKPVFLKVNFDGGHGGASTIEEQLKMATQQYAFLLWQTGHPEFQPK